MIKKLIALFLNMIVLFSVIFPSIVNASPLEDAYGAKTNMGDIGIDQSTFTSVTESGSAPIGENGGLSGYSISDDSVNSLLKNAIKLFNIFPTAIRAMLTIITYNDNPLDTDDVSYGTSFSIEKTVFGKIRMFNVNFLHREDAEDSLETVIKDKVAQFYYVTRNVAIALMLLVLIYTGIRIAITTIAADVAKYKLMLKDWLVSFIILMSLQYVMVVVLEAGNIASNLCETFMTEMIEDDDEHHIEESLLEQATESTGKGFSIVIPTILYWLLTFYQLKFFLMYCRRLMTMAFLITIAPFITVSYSIDKAGDGSAQALKTWLSEFVMGVLIQPLHAFIYMIFMIIASKIMKEAPILALIFIYYLEKSEKVVRSVFRLEKGIITAGMKEAGKVTENAKSLIG